MNPITTYKPEQFTLSAYLNDLNVQSREIDPTYSAIFTPRNELLMTIYSMYFGIFLILGFIGKVQVYYVERMLISQGR